MWTATIDGINLQSLKYHARKKKKKVGTNILISFTLLEISGASLGVQELVVINALCFLRQPHAALSQQSRLVIHLVIASKEADLYPALEVNASIIPQDGCPAKPTTNTGPTVKSSILTKLTHH